MKNLVIDKNAIKKNIRAIKERAGGLTVYADLSADACGLGLLETAYVLRDEGIRNFAISDPKDARELRTHGFIEETIMMLRSTADAGELTELIDLGVVCTVGSYDAGVAINGIAEERKTVCEVQIKVDTGLGRYGFSADELDKIVSVYKYMTNLAVVGVFTTYSDSGRKAKNEQSQVAVFASVLERLRSMGFETGVTHAFDSSSLFSGQPEGIDAVRVGPAIAGRIPGKNIPALTKVGFIETSIEEVGWFTKGHKISGGKRLRKATRLAVLSVGYYHGFGVMTMDEQESFFRRLFFPARNRKFVKVAGHKARVMGSVGMMHTIIDVTDINCTVGDTVIMDANPLYVKGLARVYRQA